jgi:hypothetical protein
MERVVPVAQDQAGKPSRESVSGFLPLAELVEIGLVRERSSPGLCRLVGLLDHVASAAGALDPNVAISPCGTTDPEIAVDDPIEVDQAVLKKIRNSVVNVQHRSRA